MEKIAQNTRDKAKIACKKRLKNKDGKY